LLFEIFSFGQPTQSIYYFVVCKLISNHKISLVFLLILIHQKTMNILIYLKYCSVFRCQFKWSKKKTCFFYWDYFSDTFIWMQYLMYVYSSRQRARTQQKQKDMNDKHQKNTQWNRTYLEKKKGPCEMNKGKQEHHREKKNWTHAQRKWTNCMLSMCASFVTIRLQYEKKFARNEKKKKNQRQKWI
jgi:hypothetical protein